MSSTDISCIWRGGGTCHNLACTYNGIPLSPALTECITCPLRKTTEVCKYRGSRRRCCDQLHICRLLKIDCTEATCAACEHKEPITS